MNALAMQYVPNERIGVVIDPGARAHLSKSELYDVQSFWINSTILGQNATDKETPESFRMFNSGVMLLHKEVWLPVLEVYSSIRVLVTDAQYT